MLRRKEALAYWLVCGLSACARSHGEITPAPIPPEAFERATCRELSIMRAKAMRTLIYAELTQNHRYAEDRTRIFGVPTPMATIFGENREAEAARLKGETLALAAQIERAGCLERSR
ncbi:hypothetical protein [Methylocystis parvus]|uniref:Lipoprotein n=1 Tax=Methylocystis parvus TaxID=134 RepID=A0A6B8M501_9HYPH|nr:hypothetical protein [Methylocystis parvus]QGM98011.1 hypothetical protein F7D14_11335 [Methylocystis parvus]WBK01673.1 hypothetical protein MMG94_08235 [Methylocystis parvus OBBP]